MFYNLFQLKSVSGALDQIGLGGLVNLFIKYPEFRAVLSLLFAFLFVIVFGKPVIRWLLKQKVGDNPEFYHKSLNELMKHKSNTPTMGGVLIFGAILTATLLLADMTNFYIHMGIICLIWLFLLGLVDDWLKLTSARRKPGAREGLYSGEKLLLQLGLAVVLGIFIHHHGAPRIQNDFQHLNVMSHSLTLPLAKFFLNLRLDVFLCFEQPDLSLNVHKNAAQALFYAQRFE